MLKNYLEEGRRYVCQNKHLRENNIQTLLILKKKENTFLYRILDTNVEIECKYYFFHEDYKMLEEI